MHLKNYKGKITDRAEWKQQWHFISIILTLLHDMLHMLHKLDQIESSKEIHMLV